MASANTMLDPVGYNVYCVVDASDNWTKMAADISIARVVQPGTIPTDTFAAAAKLMRTWNRAEGSRFAEILAEHVCPEYKCLMESFGKAQAVVKDGPETNLPNYR